jgi:hypothetical protein
MLENYGNWVCTTCGKTINSNRRREINAHFRIHPIVIRVNLQEEDELKEKELDDLRRDDAKYSAVLKPPGEDAVKKLAQPPTEPKETT